MKTIHLALLATAILGITAGCTLVPEPKADPTRYYVLTMPPGQTRATAAREVPKDKPALALHAIDMPAYLRARKNIAVRHGANEIVYHEYARWAETLEDGITRILCERLVTTSAVSNITLLPGRAIRDADLVVRVVECEGVIPSDGSSPHTRFSAEYEITKPGAAALTNTRTFVAPPAQWDGKDFPALAILLGESATALADDIAKNLPAK